MVEMVNAAWKLHPILVILPAIALTVGYFNGLEWLIRRLSAGDSAPPKKGPRLWLINALAALYVASIAALAIAVFGGLLYSCMTARPPDTACSAAGYDRQGAYCDD